jgi:polyphosphate kinase 1
VKPLLTPIGLDPAHPFPQVANKSLNFAVELSGRDAFGRETTIATVKAPRLLPRIIALPRGTAKADNQFVLLSSVIHAHLPELFGGRDVVGYSQFRVTRDADMWFDEEEVKNLRQALEGELPQRHFGMAVRLEVAAGCPDKLAQFLLRQFDLTDDDLYRVEGPVNLARMSALIDAVSISGHDYRPFVPGLPDRLRDSTDLLATIRQHDILLHHPFQSFDPVVEFIRKAADDPDVVAIKQTVYRTGVNSVLMEALIDAARRGKEVTVVVELLARFDEEANINWAERLEQVGAQVVYGVFLLKTHAKLALLLRRETDAKGRPRLQSYAHLGTGNYHPRTARLYTDFGLLDGQRRDLRGCQRRVSAHHEPREVQAAAPSAARAVHDARPRPLCHSARGAECARRQAGANHREDERAHRGSRDSRVVQGVAGGGRDRPHRPRRVRIAAGASRVFGEYPGALDHRPLSGAQPDLVFLERGSGRSLARERRLDGPQPLSPDRGRVPGARSRVEGAGRQRRSEAVFDR